MVCGTNFDNKLNGSLVRNICKWELSSFLIYKKKKKMILVFDVLSLVNSTHYLVKRILRKNEDGIVRWLKEKSLRIVHFL